MRTLKLILHCNELRSDTISILNGENHLLIRPFKAAVKDLVMVLQDSDGLKRRIPFMNASRQLVNENVKRFSSFWFESAPCELDCEIEVELR